MSLKVNLIFCIIFGLWTSVSGYTYTVKGYWKDMVYTCSNDKNQNNTYDISNQTIRELPYELFNENTIVKAHGFFGVKVVSVKGFDIRVMLLNEYYEQGDVKMYEGQLHLVGYDLWEKHITHVGIRLTIPRSGVVTLRNYVYAGAWHNELCATTISNIIAIKIVV